MVLAHAAAIVIIDVGDYLSGPDYEMRPLYLLPIVSAAWFGGRWAGLMASVAATTALFFANDVIGAALAKGLAVPLWNTMSRLASYVVVTLLVAYIRTQAAVLRRKTDELQSESILREEYIGLFVHELRHSAAAMSLAVASLAASQSISPDERAYLQRLRTNAADLEQLARQLLTIGRLEGGSPELRRTELDLREVVRAIAEASPQVDRIDVRVPAAPAPVRADRDELRRAIDNYVRNALQYSPAPSRVTVEVVESDGRVGLDVTDAGIGFDPRDATLLFRKYARLRRGTDSRSDGAGLGLYLTRLIVEAHGGTVSASSDGPGRGARFGMLLPRA